MMRRKRFVMMIFTILGLAFLLGVFATSRRDVKAEAVTEPGNEIVVTIGEVDRSAIAEADTLRKQFKFKEAIAEYQKVLETQGLPLSLRAEAEYNIGLSHTWLGEYDQAEAVFNHMLDTYKDDPNAVGYAQYCIAWVEIQKGQYQGAIARLEQSITAGNITDRELAARTLYLEGRTYLMFLDNHTNASAIFQKIRSIYPDTRIGKYRYISGNVN
jgi:tetratricopeptide (TPR) repeat protein